MWRRSSLSFSAKLLIYHKYPNYPSSSSALSAQNDVVRSLFLSRSLSLPYDHSSVSSSQESVKLGFQRSDGIRTLSSSAAIDFSSMASSKARETLDLARHYGRCYWELSKARLSLLVVATSGTGFVLGSGSVVDLAGLCWTCTGTMMVAAAANSLNQVFEKENDSKMKRTMQRPLPSGRMTIAHAATWASTMGLAGTAILATQTNALAAGLAASNLVLYAFVYTPLKQIHPVNTWVGAIVGAIPPLLGWAAASGSVSLNAMILPAALYFWQIPHFMALAYLCRNDYAAGGYRMLSLADPSGQRTASVALRNCLYLIPLGYLAYDWGVTSEWFCYESTLLTLAITATAFSFYRHRTMQKARKMFYASLLYLPIFMSGILVHRLTIDNDQNCTSEENLSAKLGPESKPKKNSNNNNNNNNNKPRPRPPVAYASVAPFPFLPVPLYADMP